MNKIILVPIEKIVTNHYQQEQYVDQEKVAEIAESLKHYRDNGTKGLLQVPTARQVNGTYQQAFGRHRLLAFKLNVEQGDSFFSEMPLIVQDLNDQEMFELMAIENLQRRDISFIEEAETFQAYMTTFDKNSVQTAERFNKTEEYVRSRLIFNQLPDSAKEQAKAGKINVSAARSLVSLNKIGGSGMVDKALKQIEKNPSDSPQEVVSDVLSNSPNTIWLDQSAGWFSANKNFPRKHLGKLTKESVQEILGDAASIAELIELDKLLEFINSGQPITAEMFPLLGGRDNGRRFEQLLVVINPPKCESCAFHTIVNARHFCGIVMCHDRKVEAWHKKELEDVSINLGIPLYQKSDGRMIELHPREAADNKLFKEGHADLRLAPASYMWNNFEGVGRDLRVVLVGALAEKRLKAQEKSGESQQTEKVNRELESKIYHTKEQFELRFGWEVASNAFVTALDGLGMPLIDFMLTDWLQFAFDDTEFPEGSDDHDELIELAQKMKKADGVKQLRRILMYDMLFSKSLEHANTMSAKKNIIELAKDFQKVAAEWNVKLPKDFIKQAEKYQAELDQSLKELKAQAKVKA